MKKSLKLLLTITLLFTFGTKNVLALAKGDAFTRASDGTISINGLTAGGVGYSIAKYDFNSSNGKYYAYCMDPHKGSAKNYKVDRILGDPSMGIGIQSYDMGVLEIIKNGYNQFNNSFTFEMPNDKGEYVKQTVTGNDLYAATSIAVRSFTLGLYGWGGDINYSGGRRMASAHINIGVSWSQWYPNSVDIATGRNCKDSKDVRTCYNNIISKQYKWYNPNTSFSWGKYQTQSYNVIYAAQQLFKLGVAKAAEVRKTGSSSSTIKATIKNTEIIEKNDDFAKKYLYVNLDVANLDATNGYINNFRVDCPTCTQNKIRFDHMEYYNPTSNNWYTLGTNTNVAKMLTLSENKKFLNGTIRIRLQINQETSNENCKNTSFTLNYNYYNPSEEYIGALLKAPNYNDKQRFLVVAKNNGPVTGSAKGSINCLKQSCDTKIETPICSDKEDEAVAKITAPTKIKSCIINQTDDVNNTYQLSANNGGVSNDYCSVFCKEDYAEIKLNPIINNVRCGGYFQLKSHVEGKKDCYTGGNTTDKSINKEQFIKDVKAAQKEMISAYDEYLMWTEASKHISSSTYHEKCGGGTYTVWSIDSGKYTGFGYASESANGTVTGKNTTGTLPSYSSGYDGTDAVYKTEKDEKTGEISRVFDYCTGSSHSGSRSDVVNYINNQISDAKKDIHKAYTKFVSAVYSYNSCTTGWTNDFKFAQRLKYYYNEYHYNTPYEPYYSLLEKANNENLYYLEKQNNTLKEKKTIEVCLGNTDESYNCLGTKYNISESNNIRLGSYNYNSSYDSVFSNSKFTVISIGTVTSSNKDGVVVTPNYNNTPTLTTPDVPVSNARFVKKTVEKEQDYKSPTGFYQIAANGKITINNGYVGDRIQLEALENKLPTSPSSTGGGIFKLLLEDFGEFYDNGELGRIFDVNGDNENKSIAESKKDIGTFDGNYKCYYYNSCRPKGCPNCDFVCDPEKETCEWKECPDCNFTCVNCLFNLDQLQINFKTISSTNFNSANREFGYNWVTNSNLASLSLISEKASTTIKEIEELNEMVFDSSNKTSDDSPLSFSIKMTPAVTSVIKDYNKTAEGVGGYANDSLTCYDATIDGKTYKNIYCYSELIDELITNFDDTVVVKGNRVNDPERRASETNSSGYWTLWNKDVFDESVIGGPSWK